MSRPDSTGRQFHHRAGHRRRGDPDRRSRHRDHQGRVQECVLERLRHRLLHLRRHTALSRRVDVPQQRHPEQFDREHQRRILQGDHQRLVRRSADILDRGRDGPPDDRRAQQHRGRARTHRPPPTLVVTPTTYSQACLGSSFSFAITGGTPSYSVTAGGGTTTVAPTGGGPGIYVVGPLPGPSTTTVLIRDQSTPQKTKRRR